MQRETYRELAARLAIGKRLPEAVYLHREAIALLPDSLQEVVRAAVQCAGVRDVDFDVVKLSTVLVRISLLAYPNFFELAFPALTTSWTVDLGSRIVRERNYGLSGNPPILHRKEILLPPGHPEIPRFAALTAEAEKARLFDSPNRIGRAKQWEALLNAAGLVVDGHQLRVVGR